MRSKRANKYHNILWNVARYRTYKTQVSFPESTSELIIRVSNASFEPVGYFLSHFGKHDFPLSCSQSLP